MNHALRTILLVLSVSLPLSAIAEMPVQAAKDHQSLLLGGNANVVANKRLVYDFWREVLEAGHLELADKYLSESYIQHNPAVPTGRAGFVKFFSQYSKPGPIAEKIRAPLVNIVAEGDVVILSFVQTLPDPAQPGKTYSTTAFDMFRIENGKLAEHWDAMTK